jgi:hypothetical protein
MKRITTRLIAGAILVLAVVSSSGDAQAVAATGTHSGQPLCGVCWV